MLFRKDLKLCGIYMYRISYQTGVIIKIHVPRRCEFRHGDRTRFTDNTNPLSAHFFIGIKCPAGPRVETGNATNCINFNVGIVFGRVVNINVFGVNGI